MKRSISGELIFSPSDLIRYLKSPFASWMDRFYLENRELVTPDIESDDERLIAETGDKHEAEVLNDFRKTCPGIVEVPNDNLDKATELTRLALQAKAPMVYQAALVEGAFAGFADFIELDHTGRYQVWDTKLARSPKPYYAIQLCCYSEMLAATLEEPLPEKFGIILGGKDRVEFRLEDFIYYYRHITAAFLAMQASFTGEFAERPEPLPRADHGRWTSYAEKFFTDTDHLVQVAGISIGQMKKLKRHGISTVSELAEASGRSVPRLAQESLERLAAQARLQCATRESRQTSPDAVPHFEVLPHIGVNGELIGLGSLPPAHPSDVFFDMEGYPLTPGGLEYLFGLCTREAEIVDGKARLEFKDWWAHDREQEKRALEGFVDWVFDRWIRNPGMHIYHYAAYEVSAVRRLSNRHDSRQDEVDELLRNNVFVDLYQVVRRGLRVGEGSYSIKAVERLYRPKRSTDVSTAIGSIVQYSRWLESDESHEWTASTILEGIRDYNEDDCISTAELEEWLRKTAADHGIKNLEASGEAHGWTPKEVPPSAIARADAAAQFRQQVDTASLVFADLVDFHRREEKPMWWRMFDRSVSTPDVLRDDHGCIEGVMADGEPVVEKQSFVQTYRFDPSQECKLVANDKSRVMFTHMLEAKLTLTSLDVAEGVLQLKVGKKALNDKFEGKFPEQGSLIPDEYVSSETIQTALTEIAVSRLSGKIHPSIEALINRVPAAAVLQTDDETTVEAAIRVTSKMSGGCLVIQGPPGTGKTYTASRVIAALLADGKRVGVASNSHKAVVNLLSACGEAARSTGASLTGVKVGGESEGSLYTDNPDIQYVEKSTDAVGAFVEGVIGGTAWLFARPEWERNLDFLFIDEAGQVSLANAVAMARCAKNLVLLGDQMQLEQPVQGSHPGDAGLSALQYALKDTHASKPDLPVFHAVVPASYGLFLGESRRMHPDVCNFISESIYQGRLGSYPDCATQRVGFEPLSGTLVARETGIVFSPVEHDGNVQYSEEEVERVKAIFAEMLGRPYTGKDGITRPLSVEDFLFIAPYNAQVRALKIALPVEARVGSVDKFQGQEAPVCILSLCSSYGEYGSRGLGFILDRNRINVAISRAQCIAVIVADSRIAGASVGSIEEMKLINLFCKLVEKGTFG